MAKKTKETVVKKDIDDFENDANLWNVISGGSGKGITLLRKIVDATFADTRKKCMPRILLAGGENTGGSFHSRILANSFCISDIRENPCRYLGTGDKHFFSSNGLETAHIITNITEIRPGVEAEIWQFLKQGWIRHDKPFQSDDSPPDFTYCNGLMVLTVNCIEKLSKQIIDAVDFVVHLEPYAPQQLELIVLQRVKYCNIGYEDEAVLKNIVKYGDNKIESVIHFLKICLVVIQADGREEITLKDVELAGKLK